MSSDVFAFVVVILAITLPSAGLIAWSYHQQRITQVINARLEQLTNQETLVSCFKWWNIGCRLVRPGERDTRWQRCVIVMTATRLVIYERSMAVPEIVSFTPDQLRWFGRPRKYTTDYNEIWLHIEQADGWHILKIRLYRDMMIQLVRALKTFVSPELVEAYRRRRPYVHVGPVLAHSAAQDIHGAWTLDEPVRLYLMPRFLLILQNQTVLRKIPLEAVQQISALRRLDEPRAQGLVRFRAEEETFAFALDQHESFATALAEAAKRTLEAPLERKQKPRDDDPEYEDWAETSVMPPEQHQL